MLIVNSLLNDFKKVVLAGGVNIIASNIINKFLVFFNSIAIAHILSKDAFGVYSYSNNLLQFFMLFSGLGLGTAMLQFCSERISDNRKNQYYYYSLKNGVIINLLLGASAFVFSFLFSFKIEGSNTLFRYMCFIPSLAYLRDYIGLFLRTKRKNKEYALILNVDTICNILFSIIGALLYGIYGYVIGISVGYIIAILIGFFYVKEYIRDVLNSRLEDRKRKRELLFYAITICFNNAISQSLYLIDTYLVGHVMQNTNILADYKIASTIPSAFYFIPQSMMVFITPYIVYQKENIGWLRKKVIKVILINGSIVTAIGMLLFLTADWMIPLVYGNQYGSAVFIYKILCFSFMVSGSLRIPLGNILGMVRMIRYNLFTSIFEGIFNVVADLILISNYGAIGAAYATLFTMILSSVLSVIGILYYFNKR